MALSINSNPTATGNNFQIGLNSNSLQTRIGNLSSGQKLDARINDAGSFANHLKLQSAIQRTDAVRTNVSNSVSYLQSQDASLGQASKIVDRISELKIRSQDITLSEEDKAGYEAEFQQLKAQLSDISEAKFNGKALYGNDSQEAITSEDGKQSVELKAADVSSEENGFGAITNAETLNDIADIGTTTNVLENISNLRAQNGATANSLTHSLEKLDINQINLEQANSRIIDTDFATESTKYAQDSIRQQFGISVATQANSSSNNAIALLT